LWLAGQLCLSQLSVDIPSIMLPLFIMQFTLPLF